MRILCLSDIHGRFGLYRPETLPDADMVVVAGDLTNWGRDPRGGTFGADLLDTAREWTRALGRRYRQVFVIAGNHDIRCGEPEFGEAFIPSGSGAWIGDRDSPDPERRLVAHAHFASLCTAFDMPELAIGWAHTTADPAEDLAFWRSVSPAREVIVSHCPPHGILDNAGRMIDRATGRFGPERHIGSPGLLEYIQRFRPLLVVCGHCHEARGFARYGSGHLGEQTLIVNCAQAVAVVEYDPAEQTARMETWEVRKP